jgi:hypothetical protein
MSAFDCILRPSELYCSIHDGTQYQTSSPIDLHKIELQSFQQHFITYSTVKNAEYERKEKKKKTNDPTLKNL